MPDYDLTPWQRLVLAFWAFFVILFRIDVARDVARLREERRASLPPPNPGARPEPAPRAPEPAWTAAPPVSGTATTAPPVTPPTPTPASPAAPPPVSTKAPHAPSPSTVASPAPSPVAPAAAAAPAPKLAPAPEPPKAAPAIPAAVDARAAIQVLAVLQREGRLVDFIEEDLTGFPDASIGAAARTVHAGCKRAIEELFRLEPVYREAEGAQVTVAAGFDPSAIRLTGNVVGKPPFKGSLRHHGWRAREVKLPPSDGKDPNILAPAEVEL
jgi:hypothetical protein